jgi:hypothetical protein
MNIIDYPLKAGQWHAEETPKRWIVWHGTMGRTAATPANGAAGRATTSIDGWNADDAHVGAPWVVDRDGTIYRTFDDRAWIFHLGLKGTQGKYDKASVGIEIANELCLERDGQEVFAFSRISPNTRYVGQCVNQRWRGRTCWARLDEVQVDAAIALTLDIANRFGIEPRFYHPSTAFDFPRCFERATIICHSNCRKDKLDLLLEPWVWEKIRAARIAVVSAE